MECNKDEAIRVRELAEAKMKNNDFEGARKIALKAQNLYPELENVTQLLSICDVHCSARKPTLGSEKDWYGILQVEKFADEVAVKKQYRRLALNLHPDKNRFPGAEAAFKLICEANAVLSDPTKKSLYDTKIRVTFRSAQVVPPPHHMNRNSQFNQQYGAHVNVSNVFSSLNQHQVKQTSFFARQDAFWTSCPFCSFKYQCDRKFVNTMLRCQKCLKNFMGYEIGAQGVPMVSKGAPESAQGYHGGQNQGMHKTGVQNGKGFSASHMGSQWCSSRQTVPPNVHTESIFKGKRVGKEEKVSRRARKAGKKCNGDAYNRKTGNLKNNRKRDRKVVSESSESFDTSSESDIEDVTAASNLNSGPSQAHFPRRSSRRRQNVSYNEEEDDDDLPISLKRSRGSKLSEDNGEYGEKNTLDGEPRANENQNGLPADVDNSKERKNVYPEESLQNRRDKGLKARGEAGGMPDIGADAVEIETECDQDSPSGYNSDKDTCQCDDPEFSDFDKLRDASCFAVNQFWACYDTADGMPRFYAKVKKVCASPFELFITWLEADPADDEQRKWIDEELPVGCGGFKLGRTQKTSQLLTFSQQVHCEKGKRGSLIIHPRKGEVWALFKDGKPENYREYKYQVVEVLSDFDAAAGSRVCYLDKIEGFVSLFQKSNQRGIDSFMIRPNELYRFSHLVPYFELTGTERDGVPVGSFELDPASLPLNPDDLYYPSKATDDIA